LTPGRNDLQGEQGEEDVAGAAAEDRGGPAGRGGQEQSPHVRCQHHRKIISKIFFYQMAVFNFKQQQQYFP
jgi:hypothetical protein